MVVLVEEVVVASGIMEVEGAQVAMEEVEAAVGEGGIMLESMHEGIVHTNKCLGNGSSIQFF